MQALHAVADLAQAHAKACCCSGAVKPILTQCTYQDVALQGVEPGLEVAWQVLLARVAVADKGLGCWGACGGRSCNGRCHRCQRRLG